MKQRTAWIAVGAAAALVLAAGAAWLLLPRGGSAEQQALAYLRALENGDLAAVEATGVEVPASAATAFAAASDQISEVAVTSSEEAESTARVHATYVLAGEQREVELILTETSGRWVPDPGTSLGAAETDAPAKIGDAVLPAGAVTALLPAEYEIIAAPAEFFTGSTTIDVDPGVTQKVALEAGLTAEATVLAQDQLDEYLTACTQPADEVVESCGIAVPSAADFAVLSSIDYRIERVPTLSLTPTSFHAGGGVLVATVSGTAVDGSAANLSYRTENWSLRGDVTFTADDIVLSVW